MTIAQKYEVLRDLGYGGQGKTQLATIREQPEKQVVIKTLDFDALGSWKDLELFEREIEILRSLDHPGIPHLLDFENDDGIVMVYEYVGGESLEEVVDSDEVWEESQAREFLNQMLDILAYLHTLIPPVVHRDIKPSNIIQRPDGKFSLIDFGAAQATTNFTGGSTFVGTNGYMAPEQLMGRAEPRSDLYSLGATTLQLMTGIHPSLLAGEGLRLKTEDHLDGAMKIVIDLLTHPLPEKRYEDAREAKRSVGEQSTALAIVSPGHLKATRTPNETAVMIPAKKKSLWWLFAPLFPLMFIGQPIFALLGEVAIWGVGVLGALMFIAIFRLIWRSNIRLRLTREGITIERGFGFLKTTKQLTRSEVLLVEEFSADVTTSHLILQQDDGKQTKFGYGLQRDQRRFLIELLTDHLDIA